MGDTIMIEKPVDSGKISLIFVNTGQIFMGFEEDTLEKWQQHDHPMRLTDKDLIKSYWCATKNLVACQ